MRCPVCGHHDSKVIDSRNADSQNATRRRRECTQCGERFTTYERCEEQPIMVVKRDGTREPFDHAKLKRGLLVASTKRPIEALQIDKLIHDIETSLQNSFSYEIDSEQLGNMVLVRLKELDKVAYIRFASVYKDFQDLQEFTHELEDLES